MGSSRPSSSRRVPPQTRRLAREHDEHRLRDVLGQVRVAHLPQSRGVHPIDVPPHQLRKGALAAALDELPEQLLVGHTRSTLPPTSPAEGKADSR
ncbi:MAG TPA: hypothetical protein VFB66_07445 [Tepidisphaeraceae bacterium]|nr:hypothetical protein [Tepidisphaeraceae bacterium]